MKISGFFFLLVSAGLLCSSCAWFYRVQQYVKAKGRLLCGTDPLPNALVKLVDEDRGPSMDDVMASTRTNANGEFYLNGSASEMGNIDPFLKIYHDCNDAGVPCQRKTKLRIPEKYIVRNATTGGEVADVGAINLEVDVRKEGRQCP